MESPKTFGSDSIANLIRSYGVPYLPMTPGASFRGLHDSIVNHLDNKDPELLICIHEELAVEQVKVGKVVVVDARVSRSY